jgi:hypothetical protein
MSQQALADVMDRFTNDPAFREALRNDPEAAIRDSGIELNEQEMATIRKMDWEIPDEQLHERVSKMSAGFYDWIK